MDDNSETESSPESTQSVVDAYLKQPTESIKSNPLLLEMDRYHFLPIFPIPVFVLKLFADTDTDVDTIH